MSQTVTLDKAGRIVIPKALRDELHFEPGDEIEIDSDEERMTLRPARSAPPMRKEQGMWVFRGSKKVSAATTDKVLQDLRERRDHDNRRMRS